VNIDEPWKNSEDVFVTKFYGYKHKGNRYDGIDIRITGDPRDINEDRFSMVAAEAKPTDKFIFTKPAIPATHWMDREEYAELHKEEPQGHLFEDGVKEQLKLYKKAPEEEKKRKFDLIIVKKGGIPADMKLTDKMFVPKNEEFDAFKVYAHHQIADYDTGQTYIDESTSDEVNVEGTATTLSWKLCDENTKREIDDEEGGKPKGKEALQKARAKKMAARKSKGGKSA
jgi:hypothetical protein